MAIQPYNNSDFNLAILAAGLLCASALVGAGLVKYKLKRMMESIPTF